jgi:chromosome segregation ATPase
MSLASNNNWALRLANLKKLKKSLVGYLDQELKISYKRFDNIDLSGIARKEEAKDILSLVEFVVYSTVNSPFKEDFIKKIMELDEDCQTQFMYFIQRAMGEGDSPLFDSSIKVENRENLILRTEKQRMAVQIQELLDEVKQFQLNTQKLIQEKEDLQYTITDLRNEMNKKTMINFHEITSDSNELELKLSEKEVKVMQLTNQLNEVKSVSEKEINKLRDELDVANAKVYNLTQSERTLQQYKKRVESLSTVKIKLKETEKICDELREQLDLKDLEIENANSLKKNLKALRDEVVFEKQNNESLVVKMDLMKKDMKKKEAEIYDLKEKLSYAENRIRDMEYERHGQDSPQNSEDSMMCSKLSDLDDIYKNTLEVRKDIRRLTGNIDVDQIRKEKLILQNKVNKLKQKSKSLQENIKMLQEELLQRRGELSFRVKQLESQLLSMTTQLQVTSQNMSIIQNDKFKYDQCLYELDQLKGTKESMMEEMKKLYEEKDQTYKKLIECREESLGLQKIINEKETALRQREITEKILNEKVQALAESEKVALGVIENLKKQKSEDTNDYMIKFVDTERELIGLKSEKSGLLYRLTEKEERIQEVLKDKADTLRILEKEHREVLNRLKEDNERRMNQTINQCDDAITQLQKERELLVKQLNNEKKNALQEWKKSMNFEYAQCSKDEIHKLKEELARKDKEINKLTVNNREIKKCWKDSTKLLKSVWKELGIETQKINNANKRYN